MQSNRLVGRVVNARWCTVVLSVALLAAGCFLTGCESDDDGPSFDFGDNNPDLVLCPGDSITAEGYPAVLASNTGKTCINGGVPAARSDQGVGISRSMRNQYPDAGFQLILFGANDVIQGYDADFTINNLRTIINEARGNSTVPVLATLTPITGSRAHHGPTARALSERIRQLAHEENVAYADLEQAFGTGEEYLYDGLHPNAEGNALIASQFQSIIQ